ncbi:MAG: hypothetical protein RLY95_9 [Pseudomonadota bacterium]
MKIHFRTIVCLFVVSFAFSKAAYAGGVLDSLADTYKGATTGWMGQAQGFAKNIFFALASLDISWWAIKNVLKKNDIADFLTGFTLKIVSIFFFYGIVVNAPTWMPMITGSFAQIGQSVGGAGSALTPSGIMGLGVSVADGYKSTWDAAPGGLLHAGSNLILGMSLLAASIFTIIGYGLIALQLLATLIEMYLVGGIGLVMLGFTGASFTSSFGEKYIGYMVSVGIKLMLIYAIAGIGYSLSTTTTAIIASLGTTAGFTDYIAISISGLLYGVIGIMVPSFAASLMNGSPSMSLGAVAGGAAAVGAGMAGAIMAGGGVAVAGKSVGANALNKLSALTGGGTGATNGLGSGTAANNLAALSGQTQGATGAGLGAQATSTSDVASPMGANAGATTPVAASNAATDGISAPSSPAGEEDKNKTQKPPSLLDRSLDKFGDAQQGVRGNEGGSGGMAISLKHHEG